MSPLRKAVRFIDREERDLHLPHRVREHAAAETLRCHVDEFVLTTPQCIYALLLLGECESAVDQRGGNAASLQRIHLVLHQGDERTDDDGHAFHDHGWKLIAEGLSSAGGHDDQRVPTTEDLRHHLLLTVEELAKAEVLPQRFTGIVNRCGAGVGNGGFGVQGQLLHGEEERGVQAGFQVMMGSLSGCQTLMSMLRSAHESRLVPARSLPCPALGPGQGADACQRGQTHLGQHAHQDSGRDFSTAHAFPGDL